MNLHRLLLSVVAPACIAIGVCACNREDPMAVRVQTVPRQPVFLQAQAPPPAPVAPEVTWTVPDGWKALPTSPQEMRYAVLQVSEANPDVVLTVIPLAKAGGALLPNVNRWEDQLSLPQTAEADLGKVVTRIEVAGKPVDTVNLLGPEAANPRMQMLGAIILHGERVWFFKLAGPASVVGPQKDKFDQFIKSIRYDGSGAEGAVQAAPGEVGGNPQLPEGHPALPGQTPQLPEGHPALPGQTPQLPEGHPALPGGGGAAPAAAQPAGGVTIKYESPQGWIKDDALMFREVSFHIGSGDSQVDVIVSRLPAATSGGYLDNVNRWRAQVGLPALNQGEPQPSEPTVVGGADGAMFDLVGPGEKASARRMMLAWIPRGDDWWFFKLVGPDEGVTQQKAAFENFLKSVEFVSQ